MSDEQGFGGSYENVTTYTYNVHNELVAYSSSTGPGAAWEHDEQKRVFRITEPDG